MLDTFAGVVLRPVHSRRRSLQLPTPAASQEQLGGASCLQGLPARRASPKGRSLTAWPAPLRRLQQPSLAAAGAWVAAATAWAAAAWGGRVRGIRAAS